MKHGLNLSSNFKNIFQASKSGCKNYGLGHKCSDFRRHSPHTFPKEINFDDQRIMVDNFRTAADHSGLKMVKECNNRELLDKCERGANIFEYLRSKVHIFINAKILILS